MIEIQTERLRLIPLSREQLVCSLENLPELEDSLGMTVSKPVLTERMRQAIYRKIDMMDTVDERLHPWYTYWLIVIDENQCGAGLVGFQGVPDDDGQIDITFIMDPTYQHHGYTTEAARALVAWAFEEPSCKFVVARGVQKDNPASRRILEKLGMSVYEETEDSLSWRKQNVLT
jgi:[ribosomal protein S5]-alanine N-acetyltransferase